MKKGFTLAEVLITLAVIGVIAVLTVPVLMTGYQKQASITGLKKVYTTMNEAIQMAETDYGPMSTWDYSGESDVSAFQEKYILPYLNVVKKFEGREGHYTIYFLNGERNSIDANFALMDGTYVEIRRGSLSVNGNIAMRPVVFKVDINGKNGPNVDGKDIFSFEYTGVCYNPDGTITTKGSCNGHPLGVFQPSHLEDNNLESYWCSKEPGKFSSGCAARIIKDGWQIKYDW